MSSFTRRISSLVALSLLAMPVMRAGSASALTMGNFVTQIRGGGPQYATDVEVNQTTGESYIAGSTQSIPNADGPITMQGTIDTNYFLMKVNAIGRTVWTKQIGATSVFGSFVVSALDPEGNIYVATARKSDVAGVSNGIFIEKWTPAGVRAWSTFISSTWFSNPQGIVFSHNYVYVASTEIGSVGGFGGIDVVIHRLNAANGDGRVTRKIGTSSDEDVQGGIIAIPDGSVMIAGATKGLLYTRDRAILRSDSDFYVARFDSSLSRLMMSKQWGTTSNDKLYSSVSLRDGGFMVAGTSGGLFAGTVNHGGLDGVLVKFGATGAIDWTSTVGSAADDQVMSIVQSPVSTNVLFTGATGGVTFGASAGGTDIIGGTVALDGQLLASKQFGTSSQDVGMGMALRADASPVIVGYTTGSFDGGLNISGDGFIFSAGTDITGITQFIGSLRTITPVKIPVIGGALLSNASGSSGSNGSSGSSSETVVSPSETSGNALTVEVSAGVPPLCNEVSSPVNLFRREVATCAGLVVKDGTKTYIRLSTKNAKGVCSLSPRRRLKVLAPGNCKVKIRATQKSGRTKAVWISFKAS